MESRPVLNEAAARTYEARGLWANRTLIDVFDEHAEATPDKILVVAGDNRWTYREVAGKVAVLARNLAALGIGHGDVVSVQLPNWAEFVLIHLALTRLGAITNPLLPVYRARELSHVLSFAQTKLAVIPGTFRNFDYIRLYRQLRPSLPKLEHICVVGSERPADMTSLDALLAPSASSGLPVAHRRWDGNDVTVLLFTSGTEALPKGVLHTHNTMMFGNQNARTLLGLTPAEIIWTVSPVSHATGLEWCVRMAIVLGGTMVMQETWEVEAALDLIEKEKCTFTTAATPFAAMLLESPTLTARDLAAFRVFFCGGAAIPPTLGREMLTRIGCRLIPCWGMSECFAATSCSITDPESKQWGTDGRAVPGSETAIFDESRTRRLQPGEVGEIATRGPHVCLGYFNEPERTASTFSEDGWLFSNDLGVMDEEGFLRVVGRKKDIINRAGLKISASEIEGLLVSHPAVRRVALVGTPDARLGERACAFVVPAGGAPPTLRDLIDFLTEQGIARYKYPEYLSVIDELPMTATGKVQKFKLREGLAAGIYPLEST